MIIPQVIGEAGVFNAGMSLINGLWWPHGSAGQNDEAEVLILASYFEANSHNHVENKGWKENRPSIHHMHERTPYNESMSAPSSPCWLGCCLRWWEWFRQESTAVCSKCRFQNQHGNLDVNISHLLPFRFTLMFKGLYSANSSTALLLLSLIILTKHINSSRFT